MTGSDSSAARVHGLLTGLARLSVFLLVLIPLVYNPVAYLYGDAFFPPKWSWMGMMAIVGCSAILTRSLIGAPLRFPFDQTWIGALVFFALHPLSLIWARSSSLAVERTLYVGAATLMMWVTFQAIRTRRTLIRLGWTIVVAGMLTAIWTLEQDFAQAFWPERAGVSPNLPDWRGFLTAGLGNTNHIGDYLALALLPGLIMFGEARRRPAVWALGLALVVIAAGLTVCWSVGSNLGLFAGAGVMLVLLFWRRQTRFFRGRIRWLLLFLAWGAMVTFFLTDHSANPHQPGLWKQAFGSERWQEGGSTRLVIWAGGLEMVRLHPWCGVGAGNFTYVYPEMRSALIEGRPELLVYAGHWTNAAHNAFLQVWSELGAPGLLAFLALIALAFHSLLRDIRWSQRREFIPRLALAAMLAAVLVQSMMNFVFQHPTGLATFYLLLGAVVVEKNARRHVESMTPLVIDKGWFLFHVDWRSMSKATGVGIAFRAPGNVVSVMALLLWSVAGFACVQLARPVLAESQYGLAATYRVQGDASLEEDHIRKALSLNPWATGCRSRYVEFLIEQNRPQEALIQLDRVRERLNSRELWMREARAYEALGRTAEAREAWQEFLRRIPEALREGASASPPAG